MIDQKLLKACMESRKAYTAVAEHVDKDELSPQASQWWDLVHQWYVRDPNALFVDPDLIRSKGKRSLPAKYRDELLEWIDDLPNVPSTENVVHEILDIKLFHARQKLAQLAANPEADYDAVREQIEVVNYFLDATSLEAGESEEFWLPDDIRHDYEVLSEENRIELAPRALNKRCKGGAVGGDHIVVFGPTEIGKSLFAINMAAHFLRKGERVMYVGNEDKIEKIRTRITSNLLGWSFEQCLANKDEAWDRVQTKGMKPGRLHMVHAKPGSVAKMDEWAERVRPKIIIVDQFRNLGGRGDSMTVKMNDNAIKFRSLIAKHDCVGLSIAQAHAGEHGKTKVWYEYDDIDSSRTGLPAQADLLVAVGADKEMLALGTRAISLCKNKLGDEHEGFIARFDHMHSRVST